MFKSRRALLLLLALVLIALTVILLQLNLLPDLSPPRVVAFSPPDQAAEILPTSPITITFSTPMDRASTERAVTITPQVMGTFRWSDERTLIFTPQSRLPISTTLTVGVSTVARSLFTRALDRERTWSFKTLARPYVVASSPAADAQFIYTPDRVTLTFNRPMERDSIEQGLVITPTLQNRHLAWGDNVLTIYGFFQPRTPYQITLPATAMDAQYHLALDREVTLTFTTAGQYPQFAILNLGRALTFPADGPITLETQLTNISRLDLTLYPLTSNELITNLTAPFENWYAFQPASPFLKTRQIQTDAELDQYTRLDERLDPLPIGLYYLRVTTPEGESDKQMLVITDLMLELEHIGDVARVQVTNRPALTPVPDVRLVLYDANGQPRREGTTNGKGIFETSLNCTLPDGDHCLDRLWVLASLNGDFAVISTR